MKNSLAGIVIPGIVAVVGVVLLAVWTGARLTDELELQERVPGMDQAPPPAPPGIHRTVIGEPIFSDGKPSQVLGAWPWFRGENLDAICDDGIRLARRWPDGGPQELWTVELGEGYAAAAVSGGRVYVLDHVPDVEFQPLHGLSQEERIELADALSSLSPERFDELEDVLHKLFPVEGGGVDDPPRIVSQEEYDVLKAALRSIFSQQRDRLIYGLRHGPALKRLCSLSREQRLELAGALSSATLATFDELDELLLKLCIIRKDGNTNGDEGNQRTWTLMLDEYIALKAALHSLLSENSSENRDQLMAALQSESVSDAKLLPDLLRWTLEDVDRSADVMRCLSLDNGKEIWRNSYRVIVARNHGRSRTIPAVAGKYVISLGPRCHVACWDAETGEGYWLLDLVRDYGATVPRWHSGQCPLIDAEKDRLVLAPAGRALLMAVDYRSGNVIWETPNPDQRAWKMTHSSITPMDFHGRRMYVYCATGGVAGVSADDGSLLWKTTDWTMDFTTCPSPVILEGGRIFLSSGYKAGSVMLQVKEEGGRFTAETIFRLKPRQFGSEQQTPILFNGYLYAVRKSDKKLVCLDQECREVWNSGEEKFGSGPYLIADGLIYVMDDDGWLTMAEATPTGYRLLDRAQVIEDGHDSWGPMAMVAGRLIVRDMTRMVCLDVAEKLPTTVKPKEKPK